MDGIKGLSDKLLASVREVLKTNQHLPRNEDLLKIASIEEMNKHQTEANYTGYHNNTYSNVLHPKHGIIGTHSPEGGFHPSKPALGFVKSKTIPNGTTLDKETKQITSPPLLRTKPKINEKLVGNQYRIDADKNGKIGRPDFKLLLGGRGKKKSPSMVDEAGQPLQYSGSVGPSSNTRTHKRYTITLPRGRQLDDYHDDDLHRLIRKQNPHLEHHEVSAIVDSAGDEESKQTVEHKGKTYTHHVVNHQEPRRLYDEVNAVSPSMPVREEQIDEALSLGVLAAKHFEHHLNATRGVNFDLSDSQMASHAKKARDVIAKIEHHFGSKVAHDVAAHSETAADYEEGTMGGGNSHPVFAKKYLGGVEHKKYNDQIDKQDLKMHGDTGVTTHHLP